MAGHSFRRERPFSLSRLGRERKQFRRAKAIFCGVLSQTETRLTCAAAIIRRRNLWPAFAFFEWKPFDLPWLPERSPEAGLGRPVAAAAPSHLLCCQAAVKARCSLRQSRSPARNLSAGQRPNEKFSWLQKCPLRVGCFIRLSIDLRSCTLVSGDKKILGPARRARSQRRIDATSGVGAWRASAP